MAAQPQPFVTPEQYLEQDRSAEFKSEYMGGAIIAMAGASYTHALIIDNIVQALGPLARRRGCRTPVSDLRVQIERTGAYVYPNVVVVCGEPRFADARQDVLLNPTVVIEVQPPTTSDYDHGPKWSHYRRLDSLAAYVMVSQDEPLVEVYTRHEDVWIYTEITDLEGTLDLGAIGAAIRLADVYDGVTFPVEPASP